MTDQLTGSALDEAAAVAMGAYKFDGAWAFPSGAFAVAVQAYSTDPATIPEMLAWLRPHGRFEFVQWKDGMQTASMHDTHRHAADCSVGGGTINEALARLVVAVAAAKGAK
ncbi:MAG: hypothetical protein RIR41_1192 [Pseudomonadota bacterium]